jgi:hypothetical protein
MAAMVATEQCRALQAEGVTDFHFYNAEPCRSDAGHLPPHGTEAGAAAGARTAFADSPTPMPRGPGDAGLIRTPARGPTSYIARHALQETDRPGLRAFRLLRQRLRDIEHGR